MFFSFLVLLVSDDNASTSSFLLEVFYFFTCTLKTLLKFDIFGLSFLGDLDLVLAPDLYIFCVFSF